MIIQEKGMYCKNCGCDVFETDPMNTYFCVECGTIYHVEKEEEDSLETSK